MYEAYKNIVAFRIVYINEAHAADGRRPLQFAVEVGITEHVDYAHRCVTAEMMMADENVTIPCLIDNMDNNVNNAYKARPTRIFLVRKDGRLGVAGGRGPWGLRPALQEVKEWLAKYKETGEEPGLFVPESTERSR